MSTLVIPEYELVAARKGYKFHRNASGFVAVPGRAEFLPATPKGFVPTKGTYYDVSKKAVALNEAQLRSGFLDYLYAPEPITVAKEEASA